MTTDSNEEKRIVFRNIAPEDKEWTAHVDILNKWTTPDRYLREIIIYARSGKHYPTDMHVDLIEQVMDARIQAICEEALGDNEKHERIRKPTHGSCCTCQVCGLNYDDCKEEVMEYRNELRDEVRQRLARYLGKDK